MALKQEIIIWDEAANYHDKGELEKSLNSFNEIQDTSRILFNCGVIHASLGEHAEAVGFFHRAVARDQYLAVAYFQCGVSNFLLGEFEEALANFNDTILCLRGNPHIDYEQLGLKYKLHFCEALFNRGLCYIYLQQKALGMQDLRMASTKKVTSDHGVIDEAIEEEAEGFVVFSIPRGIIYRPNAAKVKNLISKDYLGKARLIAAQQERANQVAGTAMHMRNHSETTLDLDLGRDYVAPGSRTYAPKPGLSSRSRLQSEPPLNRKNMFPPTPPPEILEHTSGGSSNDCKRNSSSGSSDRSVKSFQEQKTKSKPSMLDLGAAAFSNTSPQKQTHEKPRLGTIRSMSEQPRPRVPGGSSSRHEARKRSESNNHSLETDMVEISYTLKPDTYDVATPSPDHLRAHERQRPGHQQKLPLLQSVTYKQRRSKSKAELDTKRPVLIEEECEDDDNEDDEQQQPDSAVSGIPPDPPGSGSTINGSFSPSCYSCYDDRNRDNLESPFEIAPPQDSHPQHRHHRTHHHHHQHNNSRSSRSSRPHEPPSSSLSSRHLHLRTTPSMTKIRVKIHNSNDTRIITIVPSLSYSDFVEQIRKKFGLCCGDAGAASSSSSSVRSSVRSGQDKTNGESFKLKIRDEEGDMVTMGDQEDLDMAVQGCRDALSVANASSASSSASSGGVGGGGGGGEEGQQQMGKMEVWIQEI